MLYIVIIVNISQEECYSGCYKGLSPIVLETYIHVTCQCIASMCVYPPLNVYLRLNKVENDCRKRCVLTKLPT